jgi:hypothetical protein
MFTVYMDGSGTNNQARIISGAYCVSYVRDWKSFEHRWNMVGEIAGFKYFHMTEFAGCRPEEWCRDCKKGKKTAIDHPWRAWTQAKRDVVLGQLAQLINTYSLSGLGISIAKKDYDDLVLNSELKELAEDALGYLHYTYTVQLCGGHLEKWRARRKITKPMKYVFDTTDDRFQRNEIAALFIAAATKRDARRRFGFTPTGYAFASRKDVVQLLSADMLAYVAAKKRASDEFSHPLNHEATVAGGIFLSNDKLTIGKVERHQLQEWAEKEIAQRKAELERLRMGRSLEFDKFDAT